MESRSDVPRKDETGGGKPGPDREWLETDGRGGFASGTAELVRSRRYHALLLVSTRPPAGRFALVQGFDAWVHTPAGRFPISEQLYRGDGAEVRAPDGKSRIASFAADPWPKWTFRLEDGTIVEQEIVVSRETGATVLAWRAGGEAPGVVLWVRPFFSGRDYHSLHHENGSFRFEPEAAAGRQVWTPYEGVPGISIHANGAYGHDPEWYRSFVYSEERARGLDFEEDLASPGIYRFDLTRGEAVMILEGVALAGKSRGRDEEERGSQSADSLDRATRMRAREARRRSTFSSRLMRSADDYIVQRGTGKTVIAGYPWFLDWGRDTFITLRGLCLAAGRLSEARDILVEWAGAVSEGMLPNRFPDRGEDPEYNSVDASLWYAVAVFEYLAAAARIRRRVSEDDRSTLAAAVEEILGGYERGTRYGIRADADGLLAAGAPGVALTWMDARVGDRAVTARIGKPVEVQALWINALTLAGRDSERWAALAARAAASFETRFWNEETGTLFDVVDADHVPGRLDASMRPNQIFAAGGLPIAVLSGGRARRVVDAVERRLWTPIGVRSLDPSDPAYVGRYEGGAVSRDGAYHQGTVWPWLLGPFVEAWVRVRGAGSDVVQEARRRFLDPLLAHLGEPGLGHLSEVADGDAPHRPGGCPFQAWSASEALRLDREVLAEDRKRGAEPRAPGWLEMKEDGRDGTDRR